jgi:hypothetical protein
MIPKMLTIRYIQIKRNVQDLSVGHMVALLAIIGFFGLGFFSKFFTKKEDIWILVGIAAMGVFYLHLSRPDKRFINIVTDKTYPIFVAEYTVLLSPIFVLFLFTKNYFPFLILFLSILCIPLINIKLATNKGISFFSKYIPASAFEWRGGMRKWGIYILLFYILALAFSWVRIAPFILLFFALTNIAQFFFICEPLSILTLFEGKTNAFLRKKIGETLFLYSIVTLPIIIAASILVSDLWYLAPIFYGMACINLINFILTKYAFYYPNHDTRGGGMLATLGLMGCLIPFLAPIPLFLLFWNYMKAKRKLDYYLNEH